jgi:hypothetical protein
MFEEGLSADSQDHLSGFEVSTVMVASGVANAEPNEKDMELTPLRSSQFH